MCGFCDMWVGVCVCFVMCGCVYVWCFNVFGMCVYFVFVMCLGVCVCVCMGFVMCGFVYAWVL